MFLELYELLFLLMATLPGIYLAAKKNFLYTPNPKYNLFIIRLLFTIPFFLFFNVLASVVIVYVIDIEFPAFSGWFVQTFGYYAASIVPLFFSVIIIICLKKYLPEFDAVPYYHKDYDLYLYSALDRLPDGRGFGTKYEIVNKVRGKDELTIRSIVGPLIIDGRYMRGNKMGQEIYGGEIVVTEEGLEILNEENLSGYYTRPVKLVNGFSPFSKWDPAEGLKCYQLVCNHLMPEVSSLTKINVSNHPLSVSVSDDKLYYSRKVLSEVSDFNQTVEYFGGEFLASQFVQRYWIVTKKAKDVLINRLGQNEDDFSPVYLVDDDGNVID